MASLELKDLNSENKSPNVLSSPSYQLFSPNSPNSPSSPSEPQPQPQVIEVSDEDLEEEESCWSKCSWQRLSHSFHAMSQLIRVKYYFNHAWREMTKRKFNYCLGTFSVLIVVLVSASCYTLLEKAPVVFLQQAEADNGQFDMMLSPSSASRANFVNYSQVSLSTSSPGMDDSLTYHTPRFSASVSLYPSACTTYTQQLGLDWRIPDWKYVGSSGSASLGLDCDNVTVNCLKLLCGSNDLKANEQKTLLIIDSEKEARMGGGRTWGWGTIPAGEALISNELATIKNVEVGDILFVTMDIRELLNELVDQGYRNLAQQGTDIGWNETFVLSWSTGHFTRILSIPIKVSGILTTNSGKFPELSTDLIVMEYQYFLDYILDHVHPNLYLTNITDLIALSDPDSYTNMSKTNYSTDLLPLSAHDMMLHNVSRQDLYSYASFVLVNLPPPRINAYMDSNYDHIQTKLIQFSTKVMYYIGFPDIDTSLPILDGVSGLQFFSLFLGLILSVILTILFVLSTMLIYSLLLISIETRTFELGIHRMVGMTTSNLVFMLLTQALSYALPAFVFGLVIAQIVMFKFIKNLEHQVQVPLSRLLTPRSIWSATLLGILIPLASSILPIRSALTKRLQDTLDTRHSKTQGVKFTFERSEHGDVSFAWVVVGLGLFVFGFFIYYLLPLSLLSFNLALFFNIFFGILLGMLVGLILLALNFQFALERLVIFVFLWWEKPSIPTLVVKNLIAHKIRNRKTAIMYALSLGFVLFITVAYRTEIISAQAGRLKRLGARMNVHADYPDYIDAQAVGPLENVVKSHPAVKSFTWTSRALGYLDGDHAAYSDTYMTNAGHAFGGPIWIQAVSPNFFEVAMDDFLIPDMVDTSNGLSLSEQLYTVRGSQSVILGTSWRKALNLQTLTKDSSFVFALQKDSNDFHPSSLSQFRLKPLATLDSSPFFGRMSRFSSNNNVQVLVSFPTLVRLSGGQYKSISDIKMSGLLINFADQATDKDIDNFKSQLQKVTNQYSGFGIGDFRDIRASLQKSDTVMTAIFSSATYVAMFLCLFSLMASMYTNIYEQSKEIAIMRAMGLRGWHVIKIYIYEAFVLTLAASLLGIFIGTLMGWTVIMQRVLFTQLPVVFLFPYDLFLLVLVGSLVCSLLSAFAPARVLVTKSAASIMRTVI